MRGKVLCLGVVCAENENDPLASGFCLLASKKCPGGVSQRENPARAIATPDHQEQGMPFCVSRWCRGNGECINCELLRSAPLRQREVGSAFSPRCVGAAARGSKCRSISIPL